MTLRDYLAENYGPEIMLMDGYDDCILGVVGRCGMEGIVVYDRDKVIGKLISEGMTEEDAIEFHEFNQAGAYVGERTPMFLSRLPEDICEEQLRKGSEKKRSKSRKTSSRTKASREPRRSR